MHFFMTWIFVLALTGFGLLCLINRFDFRRKYTSENILRRVPLSFAIAVDIVIVVVVIVVAESVVCVKSIYAIKSKRVETKTATYVHAHTHQPPYM